MRKLSIFLCLILASCTWEHETHGHYKFDHTKIKKNISMQKVIKTFGPGLKVSCNENTLYYLYAKNKIGLFTYEIEEAKILRLEFDENSLIKIDFVNFNDYNCNNNKTNKPDMELNIFKEIISGIGEFAFSEHD